MTPALEPKDGKCSWNTNVSLQDPPAGSKQKINHDRRPAPRMKVLIANLPRPRSDHRAPKTEESQRSPTSGRNTLPNHFQTLCLTLRFGSKGKSNLTQRKPVHDTDGVAFSEQSEEPWAKLIESCGSGCRSRVCYQKIYCWVCRYR